MEVFLSPIFCTPEPKACACLSFRSGFLKNVQSTFENGMGNNLTFTIDIYRRCKIKRCHKMLIVYFTERSEIQYRCTNMIYTYESVVYFVKYIIFLFNNKEKKNV